MLSALRMALSSAMNHGLQLSGPTGSVTRERWQHE
ncbi:hypothetical protein YPF_2582 [Yersinia pestis biovar Orientalis str. India 195]|nr:hypothetical protein YPF_2582 [Yersinia pestis biovar Orientalis str. India 195]EEO90298.1 hypothetical protein YPS_2585 [Yersinia pestis Pestoides A]